MIIYNDIFIQSILDIVYLSEFWKLIYTHVTDWPAWVAPEPRFDVGWLEKWTICDKPHIWHSKDFQMHGKDNLDFRTKV